VAEVINVIGEVKDKTAVIIDDIIDTAGTVVSASRALDKKGAKEVIICASHGLLSGEAVKKIKGCPAEKVVLLDTISLSKEKRIAKIEIISTAPLLANVIKRIHLGKSLGALFTWEKKIVAM